MSVYRKNLNFLCCGSNLFLFFSTDIGLYEDLRSWDVESSADIEKMPVGFLVGAGPGHREIVVEIDEDGFPLSSL